MQGGTVEYEETVFRIDRKRLPIPDVCESHGLRVVKGVDVLFCLSAVNNNGVKPNLRTTEQFMNIVTNDISNFDRQSRCHCATTGDSLDKPRRFSVYLSECVSRERPHVADKPILWHLYSSLLNWILLMSPITTNGAQCADRSSRAKPCRSLIRPRAK